MSVFCTIITPDFLPFARILLDSLKKQDSRASLHVLLTSPPETREETTGLVLYDPFRIRSEKVNEVVNRYEGAHDNLRWSLKPFFLLHLLESFDKVVYTDSDLYFFEDYRLLFQLLDRHSVLLTPHRAGPDPFAHEEKFSMNFLAGLYNAGLVAVSKKAVPSLQWWARACLYRTVNDMPNGFFVDQRYLDMIPVLDEAAAILRHEGYNIGSWNVESCPRSLAADGKVLISHTYPVVCIHFNHQTIHHILNGNDPLLRPYFDSYQKAFEEKGYRLETYLPKLAAWKNENLLTGLKRKLTIRTRIKRILFSLAKKI